MSYRDSLDRKDCCDKGYQLCAYTDENGKVIGYALADENGDFTPPDGPVIIPGTPIIPDVGDYVYERIQQEMSSSGLALSLNEDGSSYTVTGIGSCETLDIKIDRHNGLPITAIETQAFAGENLTSVIVGKAVGTIGSSAFAGCGNLLKVFISSGVEDINDYAFENCAQLIEILVAENNIGGYLSKDGNLYQNIDNLTKLITYAISKKDTSFTVPDEVTIIGSGAFSYSSILTEVILPAKLVEIEARAFFECPNLTKIDLPSSIEKIGGSAFSNMDYSSSLTEIICRADVPPEIQENTFGLSNGATIYVPADSLAAYEDATNWTKFKGKFSAIVKEATE